MWHGEVGPSEGVLRQMGVTAVAGRAAFMVAGRTAVRDVTSRPPTGSATCPLKAADPSGSEANELGKVSTTLCVCDAAVYSATIFMYCFV